MNITYIDDTLKIELPKRIDANNANELEKELLNVPELKSAQKIIMNADELNYISSIGLRVILKFRKKLPNTEFVVVNVSNDIYSILEMTGFISFLDVKKKLRFVDINPLELLGAGMYGSVYRINEEQILKVFHGIDSEEEILPIIDTIRTAFVHGIPTIIPFEIVMTEKGIGTILELLNSETLAKVLNNNPNKSDKYLNDMVELLKLLANTTFDEGELRSRNDMLLSKLEGTEEFLQTEEISKIKKYINAIPRRQTAVHGDFHDNNLMLADDKPILIDMDEFSLGHPIWDVANANCVYQIMPHMNPKFADDFFELNGKISYSDFYFKIIGCTIEEADIIWNKFFNGYFDGYSQEDKNSILNLVEFYGKFKFITWLIDNCNKLKNDPERLAGRVKHLTNILNELEEQNLDELLKCLNLWK